MRSTRATLFATLITTILLSGTPMSSADESDGAAPASCVNANVALFGSGIHLSTGVLNTIHVSLTSGSPADGFSVGAVIIPSLCKAPDITAPSERDLDQMVATAQSSHVPRLPLMP